VGMMGGKLAHEYMYLTPFGEDTLLICDDCGYAANRHVATFKKEALPKEDALGLEKVATPDCKTIAELAEFLGIPESRTAKAVFMVADIPEGESSIQKFVFAIVRGDMDINEVKLANALKASELRPATEDEIEAIGAVPGYASPIGLPETNDYLPVVVLVDDLIPQSSNLVAGANDAGYHMLNTNLGRDYQADIVTDLTAARAGDTCLVCGGAFNEIRGVEVGNIFKLGTRYSDSMGCTYQDKDGVEKPVIMGSYGIGSGRLLASVAEEYNDEYGLIWPITVAPYQVHLVMLPKKKGVGNVEDTAARLYEDLQAEGIEVLFDDRDESPGVKFNDADLIGLPIRLTVSARGLEDGNIEFKRRDQKEKYMIPKEGIIEKVKNEIIALKADIQAKVVEVHFEE